jgi:hypothetical protein
MHRSLLVVLLLAACDGNVVGRDTPVGMCGPASPGASPQRRLTRDEYDATVRDLLGTAQRPARAFAPDPRVHGFTNNAEVLTVREPQAQAYLAAAEDLAEEAITRLPELVPCAAAAADRACARELVVSLGARAYRHPLTPGEIDILMAVYDNAVLDGTFTDGAQDVITAMLVAPQFLYRLEAGGAVHGTRIVRVSGHDMASRLSYFITGTMPDDELLAAAADGRLDTDAGIDEQAARLLERPEAREAVGRLHREWLRIDGFAHVAKDAGRFPDFTPAIRASMQAEADALLAYVFWEEEGDLDTLFGTHTTFRDAGLAAFMGDPPVSGDGLQRIELAPERSAGILTNPVFAAVNAGTLEGNPVKRGRFVRETLLGQPLPEPPVDLEIVVPPADPTLTTRQRFAQHSSDPTCAGCHVLMDPIGFGFEHLDGVGRWQDSENGVALTGAGELTGTDVDGPFVGLGELGQRLAQSETVRIALVASWFRFAYGREPGADDACTIEYLERELAETRSLKALFVALTRTDAFRFRRVEVRP